MGLVPEQTLDGVSVSKAVLKRHKDHEQGVGIPRHIGSTILQLPVLE